MRRTSLLLALGLVMATVACVPDTGIDPERCAQPTITVELGITSEGMDPADVAVCRDQEVTLAVRSEVDGILHIHGYDAELPASPITAGDTVELIFDAARSGQFPVELHPTGDPAGMELGMFRVLEP